MRIVYSPLSNDRNVRVNKQRREIIIKSYGGWKTHKSFEILVSRSSRSIADRLNYLSEVARRKYSSNEIFVILKYTNIMMEIFFQKYYACFTFYKKTAIIILISIQND